VIKPIEHDYDPPALEDFDPFTDLADEVDDTIIEDIAVPVKVDIVESTVAFFGEASPLAEAGKVGGRPYEPRPQQAEMALRTAEALRDNHNLCVEAPTGVGKSFAYLVPLIHYSKQATKPVIISTETINLQEQLYHKDIPILSKIMGIEFKACLAKGRSNYLCKRRLRQATGSRRDEFLPLTSMLPEIERVALWAEEDDAGSRSTLDFRVEPETWQCVCSEGGNCAGPKCEFFKKCFYWKARMQWEKADVIVANHALFFTDLKMKQEEDLEITLLPMYSAVVIDEAHTLERNAAEYLGLRVNSGATMKTMNRLFNPETGKGLLLKAGEDALELRSMVAETKEQSLKFFHYYEKYLAEESDSVRRVKHPNVAPDLLSQPMNKLGRQLRNYIKIQDDDDFKLELDAQAKRCDAIADGVNCFVSMSCPEHVYWAEEEHNGLTLNAAPLNVNMLLNELLFAKDFPVIVTSATLTVHHKLDYYRQRTGYGNGAELVLGSPFSDEQGILYLPGSDMPEPNHPDYNDGLVESIRKLVAITHGKAFVLFTSYSALRYCAEELEPFFRKSGINLLVQGEQLTRSRMLEEFKDDVDSVLFGTDSFWTGVDVPGEALSNVIVTKFPFAVPTHPLIQARCEQIEAGGRNPFMEYSLPEAVLKFRQGVGRLIRSRKDHGIIAILDRRVTSKRYGSLFINSIPNYQQKKL
jgi:ATP-dependent DNA helicase DinG